MKTILYLFIILSGLFVIPATAQETTTSGNVSYEIDFVFTGQVKGQVDSLFALQYVFSKADFATFRKLYLESSAKKYSVNTGKTTTDSLEIVQAGQKVYLRFKRYDKYDLPVLMQAEDKSGRRSPLYLRHKDGRLTTGAGFKDEIRSIRRRVSQNQTKP
jgi:hypothetical protein